MTSTNNKKQHNPEKPETIVFVTALTTYNNEAISANSSRIKAEKPSNQASLKMESRLKQLLSLLELLLVPLHSETKEFPQK